ncbi:hypothetical protein FRC06_007603, partial [Ceratobasidium sp. 370]
MSSSTKTPKGFRSSVRVLGRNMRDIFQSPSPSRSPQPQLSDRADRPLVLSTNPQPTDSAQPSQVALLLRPSNPPPSPRQVARNIGQVAWDGLKLALSALEQSSDTCPPLKSATSGLLACLDILK